MEVFRTAWCRFARTVLPLGIRGEHMARRIEVLLPDEPAGSWALNVQAPSGTVYPAAVDVSDGVLAWDITGGDTAVAGAGRAELVVYGTDGEIIKSEAAYTLVRSALPEPEGEAPDPFQSWLDQAYDALNAIQSAQVLPVIEEADNGKVLTAENGAWVPKTPAGNGGSNGGDLPAVTGEDDGKVLTVQGGAWVAAQLPTYEGEYIITPSAADVQTLSTARKLMPADVTVQKIPYFETSNTSGGNTVYIGSEVEAYGD